MIDQHGLPWRFRFWGKEPSEVGPKPVPTEAVVFWMAVDRATKQVVGASSDLDRLRNKLIKNGQGRNFILVKVRTEVNFNGDNENP